MKKEAKNERLKRRAQRMQKAQTPGQRARRERNNRLLCIISGVLCYAAVLMIMLDAVAPQKYRVEPGEVSRSTITATKDVMDQVSYEAARKAADGLHPASLATGSYKAIISGETVTDLLSTFASVFSADAAQKGISLLGGQEGEEVASEALTLYDDPLYEGAMLHSTFDDEGVATFSKAVIDKGVLKTLLHNLKTAHKAGLQSTGNGSKAGYSSGISVAPRCFFIKPSEITPGELLERMGEGVYITELNGLHSGANPASGDFSLSARGYAVRGGKKCEAVSDFTVTGNFYELLKNVEAVASKIVWALPPEIGSPDILISSIMVSGKK